MYLVSTSATFCLLYIWWYWHRTPLLSLLWRHYCRYYVILTSTTCHPVIRCSPQLLTGLYMYSICIWMFKFPKSYNCHIWRLIFQRQPIHYRRMYNALGLLVDFFHANEKGLHMQKIQSDQYKVRIPQTNYVFVWFNLYYYPKWCWFGTKWPIPTYSFALCCVIFTFVSRNITSTICWKHTDLCMRHNQID